MKHGLSDHFPLILVGGAVFAVVLVLSVSFAVWHNQPHAPPTRQSASLSDETDSAGPRAYTQLIRADKASLQALLDVRGMPNISIGETVPIVTGDVAADNAIREQAMSLGLRRTGVPILDLMSFSHDPSQSNIVKLQPHMFADLTAVLDAAREQSMPLRVVGGYESIVASREAFLAALADASVTVEQLPLLQEQAALKDILLRRSPPGYSWRHTGFAVEFACDELRNDRFVESICYSWLRRTHFENALSHGFVPVLPEYDEREQLINLRPWQYVWVGRDATYRD